MKHIATVTGIDPVACMPPRPCRRPWPLACVTVLVAVLSATPFAAIAAAANCVVDTSGATIAFGVYDPLATLPATGVGTIVVTCSSPANKIQVTVSLSPGGSGSYFPRRMASAGNQLDYNLYTDAARNIVFGNGTGGTQTTSDFTSPIGGGSFSASVPVYGAIPAQQDAAFGQYSDTIQVTVTF